MKYLIIPIALSFVACTKSTPTEPDATAAPTIETASTPTASAAVQPKKPTGSGMSKLDATEAEIRATIPPGAGDYARAVALATLYKRGDITFEELQAAILAMKLPPYKLGDPYLLITPPPPPNPDDFDPKMMPKDWAGTWGVVAQAHHLGELTKDEYDKLHRAAHPTCKH